MKYILILLTIPSYLCAQNGFFKEMAEEKEIIAMEEEGLDNRTQILAMGSVGSELSGDLRTFATQGLGYNGVSSFSYGLRVQHNFHSLIGVMGGVSTRSIGGTYDSGTSYNYQTGQEESETKYKELWTQRVYQAGMTFTPLYQVKSSNGILLELAIGPQFNTLHGSAVEGGLGEGSGFGYFIQPTFGGQNGLFLYKIALNWDTRYSQQNSNSQIYPSGLDQIETSGLDLVLALGVIF